MKKLNALAIAIIMLSSLNLMAQSKLPESELLSCFDKVADAALLKKLESKLDDYYVIKLNGFESSWRYDSSWRIELVSQQKTSKKYYTKSTSLNLDGEVSDYQEHTQDFVKEHFLGDIELEANEDNDLINADGKLTDENSWKFKIYDLLASTPKGKTASTLQMKLYDTELLNNEYLGKEEVGTYAQICEQVKRYVGQGASTSKESVHITWDWNYKWLGNVYPNYTNLNYSSYFISSTHPWVK